MDNKRSLEVIIPAYMPDEKLDKLIKKLCVQEIRPDRIRILLTTDGVAEVQNLQNKFGNSVEVEKIGKEDFSHGGTRQYGVDTSSADFILFMTQDAVPVDTFLTKEMEAALSKSDAAMVFARQIAFSDADEIEKFSRRYNYPRKSYSNTKNELESKGIKAIFCSDSCAMYKRAVHNILGGFDRETDFNEDSMYAYKAITSGYSVIYCAEARVYHSHKLTLKQQFNRNKAIAVCQKNHPDIYGSIVSEKEGIKYLFTGTAYFIGKKQFKNIFKLWINCIVRYAGFFAGKHSK